MRPSSLCTVLLLSALACSGSKADSASADGSSDGSDGTTDGQDGADGTADGQDGSADGADGGSTDGADGGSTDGADGGTTDGGDGGDGGGPWDQVERSGYSYNPIDYSWDGGETLVVPGADGGDPACVVEASTGGNLSTTHDCSVCDQAWELQVYSYAGTGPLCADLGLDESREIVRSWGYAASTSHDGATLTDALLAKNPDGDWVVVGQATIPGAAGQVDYVFFAGQPAWERPEAPEPTR